jgi:undecaprenyl-diphosphatase
VDLIVQALVMGIVQGLTEFVPISSSGHLIILPFLAGWDDEFLTSLAFTVMLHVGTLVALLVYFRDDWLRLVPAGLATIRDRSLKGDPDRTLAWLLVATTVPAVLAGLLLEGLIVSSFRSVGVVAVMLVVGGVIMLLADRLGPRTRTIGGVTFPIAIGIGTAQALALVPGISRSGASITAGRIAGLDREPAARFAFLMATPITVGAILYEGVDLLSGESGLEVSIVPLVVGMVAALLSGLVAIRFMLSYLRRQSLDVFVAYRFVLAAIVLVIWLAR